MPDSTETQTFIRNNFRSVWALELLLLLKSDPSRMWSRSDMVDGLRGSESIIRQSCDSLLVSGLILLEDDGSAQYAPASADLVTLAEKAELLYRRRPDAVRRMIVKPVSGQLTAFADAFRLKGD
jgi:hypothetical protein